MLFTILFLNGNLFAQPLNNWLEFDGSDDYVNLGNSSTLKPTNALSFELWAFNANWSTMVNQVLISNTQAGGYNIEAVGNQIGATVRLNGEFARATISTSDLSTGWHHFAVSCDGQYVKFYVDAVLKVTADAGGTYPIQYGDDNCTLLGAEPGGACTPDGFYFIGFLDEVRIWGDVRTQQEIEDNMNLELNLPINDLLGYWKLNETSGNTASDETGNNNDGTLINMPTNPWMQRFTESPVSLAGVENSSVDWGDYNNDGHLDILLTGWNGSSAISKIYKNNDDGSFTEQSSISLTGVYNSSVDWGDYNNDGYLDILLAGSVDAYNGISKVYKNNGNGTFTEQSGISLIGVSYSAVAWGDYDNDGDLDILLTGQSDDQWNSDVTKIYKNNGDGSFSDSWIYIIGFEESSVAWGDYDNDGDLDILVNGAIGSSQGTRIYRNDGNDSFTQANTPFILTHSGSVAWGDYDDDGDLDVLLTGVHSEGGSGTAVSKIYKNNGDGSFSDSGITLKKAAESDAAWGDYDNDGDLDIIISGYNTLTGDDLTRIYKNDGNNSFLEQSGISITGTQKSSLAWGDYDNDGDLDVLITGKTNAGSISKVYDNNCPFSNSSPNCPTNLSSSPSAIPVGSDFTLSWDAASDAETSTAGLYYNIRIGTTPGGSEIMEAMSKSSGLRKLVQMGNTNQNTSWTITKDLPLGTYYWSVQTIDAAWEGSAFAPEASFTVESQFLENDLADLTDVYHSSVAWGDYDNDGDLDILLCGRTDYSNKVSKIYKNNGNDTFTEQSAISLVGVEAGAVVWGDYDNDGFLDILLCGSSSSGYVSKIYKNNGDGSFAEQTGINLTGVSDGDVDWGDYDNDGFLDILLTGLADLGRVSKIYKNNGNNTFIEQTEIGLTPFRNSSAAWGDYDNDGDLDILLCGEYGGGKSKIYKNEGDGTFSEQTTVALTGVELGSVAWGDYDNDGDLDILLSGDNGSDRVSKIYKNNGDGTFTEQTGISLTGVRYGDVCWGDSDNDGDLDILLTGMDINSDEISKIYINNGDGTFSQQEDIFLEEVWVSSVAWGDYDNDGDLDILLTGENDEGRVTKIYKNIINKSNTVPNSPSGLSSSADASGITLNWDAATDNETPSAGLSYNIRIGTTSEGCDIFTPMSIAGSGYRKIPALGNTNLNTSWIIKDLPFGTYHWSVQSIDNNFAGSAFANEGVFYITGIPDNIPGNALDFDGVDDYVEIPDESSLDITECVTIEAWIYITSSDQGGGIVCKGYGDGGEAWCLDINDGKLRFYIRSDGTGYHCLGETMVFNKWIHVVGQYDGSNLITYFNGIKTIGEAIIASIDVNDHIVSIGSRQSGSGTYDKNVTGKIDEVRIWNIARTEQQIRENMHRPLSRNETELVGYWQFNENTGNVATDCWLGNDGTLQNMDNEDWVGSGALWKRWQGGAKSEVWSTAENWSTIFSSPTSNDFVLIESGITQPHIANNPASPANCDILKIESGATITIDAGKAFTVSDTLINEAGTSGLVLKSDNTNGTASLIHETQGAEASVERYIPQYVGATGWHYLSSPVETQAIRPEFVTNPTPNTNDDFFKFSEPDYLWLSVKDNSGNWNNLFEDDFMVGRGYDVAYQNDETKTFQGELNVGGFTFDETTNPAITFTESGGIGWNLIGNPYPSGLDWDDCERTNIDASVYAYDGNAGQYVSWNGTVGGLDDGIIPPMNAFFIKASENASLTIPNSARVHTSTNFYKSKELVKDLLVLKVEGNGFSDLTYIHFNDLASNSFDNEFDAYKLSGITEAPKLYTLAEETKLSINVLPYTNEEIAIPLCLKVGEEANYTISVSENSFWETVDVSLKDLETGSIYNLRTHPTIIIDDSPDNPVDRFLILINGATGFGELSPEDDGIEIYSYGDRIFINTDEVGEVQVVVYNMMGQTVFSRTLTAPKAFGETLSGLAPGFYLVSVRSKSAMKTRKVFVR